MSKTTNKTHLLLLQKVAEVGQRALVEALGRDPSYVSRFFSGHSGLHIDELEDAFKALGLKLIQCEGDTITLPKEQYEALRTLPPAAHASIFHPTALAILNPESAFADI